MMTLEKLRDSAFGKWLRAQDPAYARAYLYHCLATGDSDNLAWQLWETVHGDKAFIVDEVEDAMDALVNAIAQEPVA